MKKLLLFLLLIVLMSCSTQIRRYIPTFSSVKEASIWVHNNLKIILSSPTYIITPDEVFNQGGGVCKDFDTVLMEIIHEQKLADNPKLVGLYWNIKGEDHAHGVVYIPSEDQYYDPCNDLIGWQNGWSKSIFTYNYYGVMDLALCHDTTRENIFQ
jgi:hypothetical protein